MSKRARSDKDVPFRLLHENATKMLEEVGYLAGGNEATAVKGLTAPRPGIPGVRALLISGPAGTGKTFLGRSVAESMGSKPIFELLGAWTSPDELVQGVNIAAAVTGDGDNVYKAGSLLRAAQSSIETPTVLILDELDKAPVRVESLLLDFLQTGEVGGVTTDRENLLVFLTSNATRPHTDPLIRRVRRLRIPAFNANRMVQIAYHLAKETGAPKELISIVHRAMCTASHGRVLSPQEVAAASAEMLCAESDTEIARTVFSWSSASGKFEANDQLVQRVRPDAKAAFEILKKL